MPPKKCLPTQIINPTTGRCVNKEGKIGKQIMTIQNSLIKAPVPVVIDAKMLKQKASQFRGQLTSEFLKLSEEQQLKALNKELITDMINITDIFVKTTFSSVWKMILDKHRNDIQDVDLFDDQSLDKERRLELIYTVGTQAECDYIFDDIYDLAYKSDNIFDLFERYNIEILENDSYIGEISDINTYAKLTGENSINFYDLVFEVHQETFEFLLKKYSHTLTDLDVDELKFKIRKNKDTGTISIPEKKSQINENH